MPEPRTPIVPPRAAAQAPRWAELSIPREPAHDDQAVFGQVARQSLCDLIPVRRRASRSHDGNRVPAQNLHVSADIQQRRRVVNLCQKLRIFGLLPGHQANSGLAYLRQLFLRVAKRSLAENRLRRCRRHLAAFQFGERRAKNFFRPAELAQQLAHQARAQPGRQPQRQPREGVVQVHSAATLVHILRFCQGIGVLVKRQKLAFRRHSECAAATGKSLFRASRTPGVESHARQG